MTGGGAADHALATYGTLAPGRPNAHLLDGMEERWTHGTVRGRLVEQGWGAAIGYPAIVLDADAPEVAVHLFMSADLSAHWPRLDAFEGDGYRRSPVQVATADGPVRASIYTAAERQDLEGATRPMQVKAIDHIVLNVADVNASAAWYARALGMIRHDAPADDGSTRTSMTFGASKVNLRPITASQDAWFTARTPQAGSDDLCFLTDMAPDAVADHFRRLGIAVEQGPVTKQGARGPIRSVYVRDPDGNLIELSSYP